MGFTLNNITMLGLILAVGIVIDDAVVVLENIFRHMEEKGVSAREAAQRRRPREIAPGGAGDDAVAGRDLPARSRSWAGSVGRFFTSFGVTVAFAILVSLFVSFTLTPMLCSRFLKLDARGAQRDGARRLRAPSTRGYGSLLRWSLRHRWVIVLLSVADRGSRTVPLFGAVGKDFIPHDDQSEFEVIDADAGGLHASSAPTRRCRELEARLRELPRRRRTLLTTIGDTTGRLRAGEGDVTTGVDLRAPDRPRRARLHAVRRHEATPARSWPTTPTCAAACRTSTCSSAAASAVSDVEFNLARARPRASSRSYSDADRRPDAQPPAASSTSTRRCRCASPSCASTIDREQGVDLRHHRARRRRRRCARSSAASRSPSTARSRTSSTTSGCAPSAANRERPARDRRRRPSPSPSGELVRLANLATLERGARPGADRPLQPPAQGHRGRQPRRHAARRPPSRRCEAIVASSTCRRTTASSSSAAPRRWARPARNFLIAFLLSFALHVHDPGGAVRELRPPDHDPAGAAADDAVRARSRCSCCGETLDIYAMFGLFMLFGIVKKNGILQVDYTNVLRAAGHAARRGDPRGQPRRGCGRS